MFACAPLRPRQVTSVPVSRVKAAREALDVQAKMVRSFITTGRMVIIDTAQRIPATFLCVATRSPFRIKTEITHSWGLPLVNILVKGKQVIINDLYHKRTYNAQLGISGSIAGNLPALDRSVLWSIMRAYPEVMHRGSLSWSDTEQAFVLLSRGKRGQIIYLDREGKFPSIVLYPELGLQVKFSDFKVMRQFIYADHIEVTHSEKGSNMQIAIKKIIFNQEIDPEVFK